MYKLFNCLNIICDNNQVNLVVNIFDPSVDYKQTPLTHCCLPCNGGSGCFVILPHLTPLHIGLRLGMWKYYLILSFCPMQIFNLSHSHSPPHHDSPYSGAQWRRPRACFSLEASAVEPCQPNLSLSWQWWHRVVLRPQSIQCNPARSIFSITCQLGHPRGVKLFKNCMGSVNFFKGFRLSPPPQLLEHDKYVRVLSIAVTTLQHKLW